MGEICSRDFREGKGTLGKGQDRAAMKKQKSTDLGLARNNVYHYDTFTHGLPSYSRPNVSLLELEDQDSLLQSFSFCSARTSHTPGEHSTELYL